MSDEADKIVPFNDGQVRWADSFINLLAGLGVQGRDKFASQSYSHVQLNNVELENAYRSDWIARKVVTIPAWDMTREWRSWQADPDQIELLETLEKKLFIQNKLQQALIKARLYGGAAIIIGVDAGKPEDELDPEMVGQDSLKFIHVVSKNQLRAGPIIRDISSKYFGQPEFYEAGNEPVSKTFEQAVEEGGNRPAKDFSKLQVKLHPSRVVKLIGMDTADQMLNDIWGDSVLQAVNDSVKMCGLVTGSLATLVAELKVDVIKIPELKSILSTTQGTNKMLARFSAANSAKSVINTIMIDGNEEWQRIQASLAGVPEVIMAYMQTAAGAADIPATRFLGMSPAGLNATGESDIRNYYDRLAAEQETVLTPAMTILDEVLIRSALGDRPPEVWYEWSSLWQLSDIEKSDLALKKAQAYKIDVDAAQLPPNALANARANQLIEDGFYPGLEKALEDAALEGDTIELQGEAAAMDPMMEAQKMLAESGMAPPPGQPGGPPKPGGGFPPKGFPPKGGGGGAAPPFAKKKPALMVVGGDSVDDDDGLTDVWSEAARAAAIEARKRGGRGGGKSAKGGGAGKSKKPKREATREEKRAAAKKEATAKAHEKVGERAKEKERVKEEARAKEPSFTSRTTSKGGGGGTKAKEKKPERFTIKGGGPAEVKVKGKAAEEKAKEKVAEEKVKEKAKPPVDPKLAKEQEERKKEKEKKKRGKPVKARDSLPDLFDELCHQPGGQPTGGQFVGCGNEGGGGAGGKASEGGGAEKNTSDLLQPSGETVEDVIAKVPGGQEFIDKAEAKLADSYPTDAPPPEGFKNPDGSWTPERQAEHDKIIDSYFTPEKIAAATPAPGEQPTLDILGGRGGSGKSFFTEGDNAPVDTSRALELNNDHIKEKLPGYEGWNAPNLHEESSHVGGVIEKMAKERGLNVVMDGTMKSENSAMQRVSDYKDAGYKVNGHYMYTSPEKSAERALKRAVSGENRYQSGEQSVGGRYVPPGYSLGSTTNEKTFDRVKGKMDNWQVYTNNVDGQKPVFHSRKGG